MGRSRAQLIAMFAQMKGKGAGKTYKQHQALWKRTKDKLNTDKLTSGVKGKGLTGKETINLARNRDVKRGGMATAKDEKNWAQSGGAKSPAGLDMVDQLKKSIEHFKHLVKDPSVRASVRKDAAYTIKEHLKKIKKLTGKSGMKVKSKRKKLSTIEKEERQSTRDSKIGEKMFGWKKGRF